MTNIVGKNNFQIIYINIIFHFLSGKNDFLLSKYQKYVAKSNMHGENDDMDVIFRFLSFF